MNPFDANGDPYLNPLLHDLCPACGMCFRSHGPREGRPRHANGCPQSIIVTGDGCVTGVDPYRKPSYFIRGTPPMHPASTTPLQGKDGTAHVAYFDKQHQVSFIYDCLQGDWIDVSVGGYGEPLIARIPTQEFNDETPIGLALEAFETRCRRFIKEMFMYDVRETADE